MFEALQVRRTLLALAAVLCTATAAPPAAAQAWPAKPIRVITPDSTGPAVDGFLKERRGVDFNVEPWMASDEGAVYCATLRVDCGSLSPMVTRPGDPGNGVPLADVGEHVRMDIAYGGSCTAGKRGDFDHYHDVLRWAADHGLKVPGHVALYLQFGTTAVHDDCIERGHLAAFEAVGAPAAAVVRCLRQLRAGRLRRARPDHGQRHQPQLPGPQRPGQGPARQPADGGGQRRRRATHVIRGTDQGRLARLNLSVAFVHPGRLHRHQAGTDRRLAAAGG